MDLCREIARFYRVLPPAVAEDLSERQILEEYMHAVRLRQDDWHTYSEIHHGKKIQPMDHSWLDEEKARPQHKTQRQLYEERKARLAANGK